MAARQYVITPLKDLKPLKNSWRIQVKILHAYKQTDFTNKGAYSIELIVVDESGTKMSANVKKEHVKKFEAHLPVGSWKIFTTFTVNAVSGGYRVSDQRFRITFLYNTAVAPSEVVNDSKFLSFAAFDAILAGSLNINVLVDIIGQVVDCGEIKDVITNDKPNKKIEFHLRDIENNRVPFKLWGKFAEVLDQAYQRSEDGIVICFVRFAKLNLYNETRYVSNAFDASLLFIDTDLPEIVELRRILSAQDGTMTVSDLSQKRVTVPPKVDPCLEYPRLTISELLAEKEVGKYRTICTIHSIDTDWSWCYISCRNCKKKVIIEDSIKLEDVKTPMKLKFWCEVCNNYAKSVVPKFWMHFNIMDQSGHAKCMLFDSFVKQLLGGITAAELLNGNYNEVEDPQDFPDVIKGLCGQTYQLVLCNQRENLNGGNDIYNVAKVWLPHQFQELMLIDESENYHESNSIVSVEQGTLMITSGENVSDQNLMSPPTPSSKRKSEESCDVTDQNSTSKKPCSSDVVVLDDEVHREGLTKNLNGGNNEN